MVCLKYGEVKVRLFTALKHRPTTEFLLLKDKKSRKKNRINFPESSKNYIQYYAVRNIWQDIHRWNALQCTSIKTNKNHTQLPDAITTSLLLTIPV